MKIPKKPTIDKHLRDVDKPIYSTDLSHIGLFVPEIIMKYGNINKKFKDSKSILPRILGSVFEINTSVRSIKKNPYLSKKRIEENTLKELEEFAKSIGVNRIGYTKVNPDYIFKNQKILFENAIVLTMENHDHPLNGWFA